MTRSLTEQLENPSADCHDVGGCMVLMREAAAEIRRLQKASATCELRAILNREAVANTLYVLRVQLGFVAPQTDDEKEIVARILEKARQV